METLEKKILALYLKALSKYTKIEKYDIEEFRYYTGKIDTLKEVLLIINPNIKFTD